MTCDWCVFKFLRRSVNGKRGVRFLGENTVLQISQAWCERGLK